MKKDGFSLLELSVAMIIIALIVGGIIEGVSMLRQAELRRAATDLTDIRNALSIFRDKYGYLPGDIPTATQIWGRADGGAVLSSNCNDPETDRDPANPEATCNGDGNNTLAGSTAANANTEAYRLWQHLSNAKLIPGQYTGVGGPVGTTMWRISTPENVMQSAVKDGGYFVQTTYIGSTCGAPSRWTGTEATDENVRISFGRFNSAGWAWGAILTPSEAHSIDIKIDDGRPGLGNFTVFCAPVCADSRDIYAANYLADDNTENCTVFMRVSD